MRKHFRMISRGTMITLAVALVLTGCTSRYSVFFDGAREEQTSIDYKSANHSLEDRRVEITCRDGEVFLGESIILGPDTTTFLFDRNDEALELPIDELERIEDRADPEHIETWKLPTASNAEAFPANINRRLRNRMVVLVLKDGCEYHAFKAEIGPHRVRFFERYSEPVLRRIATRRIKEVGIVSHVAGALEGIGAGMFDGAFFGAALGAAMRGRSQHKSEEMFLAAAGGGILGAAGGLIYGTVRGHVTRYEIRCEGTR